MTSQRASLPLRPVIARMVAGNPATLGYVLATGALALVPALVVPLLLRAFVDEYLVANDPQWAVVVVVGLFGAAALLAVLTLMQHWVVARLATRLSAQVPTTFVWHALRASAPAIDAMGPGVVSARGSALQSQAYQAGYLVPLAFSHVVELTVFAIALLVLDLRLGLAALCVVAASTFASWLTLRARAHHQVATDALRVEHSALTSTIVCDIESVKAAAAEAWVFDRWCQGRTRLGLEVSQLGIAGQQLGAIPMLTQTLGLGVILGIGAAMVLAGQLSVGTLLASQGLLLGVLIPAAMVLWLGVLLQGVASSAAQADLVADLELDPEVMAAVRPVVVGPMASAGVALRQVSFGYDPHGPALLPELDLEVAPGQTVALVGGSGSGKSTIVRLAIGELQPWSGVVELAGHPRARLARADRARLMAYVPQDPVLVPGTIRENLTMFDDSVPMATVLRAARDAGIEDAIAARPRAYSETISPSGHGFSGGEVQRLAIARALVGDPAVIVLDEATSALDPVVEAVVAANLRRRGCTCLIVAHRLSAVRDADLIVVLDGGRIVQRGPFAELVSRGRFRELVHG